MPDVFVCTKGHVSRQERKLAQRLLNRAPRCEECNSPGYTIPLPPGFDLISKLGAGGMGIVIKAVWKKNTREVALKLLKPAFHGAADQLERFFLEAEAMRALSHPNIVEVYEVGEVDGLPYLASELVTGGTLRDLMMAKQEPNLIVSLGVMSSLARAVHFMHGRGIVHRDLKPGNVLMTEDREPKLTDFGLAKFVQEDHGLTMTGLIMGTPSYMAPEQAKGYGQGDDIGPAADVYSLGVILYQLLTGQVPFSGQSSIEILHKVIFEEARLPSLHRWKIPPILDEICASCMEKKPGDRLESAEKLAELLDDFLADYVANPAKYDTRNIATERAKLQAASAKRSDPAGTEVIPPAAAGAGAAAFSSTTTPFVEDAIMADTVTAPDAVSVNHQTMVQEVGLLQGLTIDQVDALLSSGNYRNYEPGEIIFEEGDPARSLFLILKGNVEIYRERDMDTHTLCNFGPNEVFGEIGLLFDDGKRTAAARADGRATLFEMPGNPINLIKMFADPKTAMAIVRNLIRMLRQHLLIRNRMSMNRAAADAMHSESPPAVSISVQDIIKSLPESLRAGMDKPQKIGALKYLFREGEEPDGFYFIHKGVLEAIREDAENGPMVLARMEAPTIVGEVGFFSDQRRAASIRAIEPVEYTHVTAHDFGRLKNEQPQQALNLYFAAAKYISFLIVKKEVNAS